MPYEFRGGRGGVWALQMYSFRVYVSKIIARWNLGVHTWST